jgi:hypothetical protein
MSVSPANLSGEGRRGKIKEEKESEFLRTLAKWNKILYFIYWHDSYSVMFLCIHVSVRGKGANVYFSVLT